MWMTMLMFESWLYDGWSSEIDKEKGKSLSFIEFLADSNVTWIYIAVNNGNPSTSVKNSMKVTTNERKKKKNSAIKMPKSNLSEHSTLHRQWTQKKIVQNQSSRDDRIIVYLEILDGADSSSSLHDFVFRDSHSASLQIAFMSDIWNVDENEKWNNLNNSQTSSCFGSVSARHESELKATRAISISFQRSPRSLSCLEIDDEKKHFFFRLILNLHDVGVCASIVQFWLEFHSLSCAPVLDNKRWHQRLGDDDEVQKNNNNNEKNRIEKCCWIKMKNYHEITWRILSTWHRTGRWHSRRMRDWDSIFFRTHNIFFEFFQQSSFSCSRERARVKFLRN